MTGLALYADTAAQTRSVGAAAMLYELIEPHADQFIWNAASLELSRHHGYGAFEPRAAAIVASHAAVEP